MADISVVDLAHKVPIVETIEHYIKIYPKNGKYYGLCPFHNDKRVGSFVIFPDVSSEKRAGFSVTPVERRATTSILSRHILV